MTLGTLALCAFFIARGVTSYAASRLFPSRAGSALSSRAGSSPHPAGSEPPSLPAILGRNAFDPSTGSLPKPSEPPTGPIIAEPPARARPKACEQTMKLTAAVHSRRTPERSLGSLTDGSSTQHVFRKGTRIAGHEVVEIFPNAVYLRKHDGTLCSLRMFAGASDEPLATPPVPATATPESAELDAAITKRSETSVAVKRSFVEKLLAEPSQLMSLARLMPHEEDGRVVGVKIYGVRRTSALGRIGLQNGDLLRDINGMSLADPNSALEAFAKLRSASDLKVAITRRDQPTSLSVEITP
jgi:general secretion pathway protein C